MGGIVVPELAKMLADYAKTKNKNIYLVGGAVRDSLLNRVPILDFDLCGDLSLSEIFEFCSLYGYEVSEYFANVQVVKFVNSPEQIQYAALRKEEYATAFSHQPAKIQLVKTPQEDYPRRDFTINSLYYSLESGEILDFCGGMSDITDGIIREIVVNGYHSLDYDPERILRMIELAFRFNFLIESKTLLRAEKNKDNIFALSEAKLLFWVNKIKASYKAESWQRELVERFGLKDCIF